MEVKLLITLNVEYCHYDLTDPSQLKAFIEQGVKAENLTVFTDDIGDKIGDVLAVEVIDENKVLPTAYYRQSNADKLLHTINEAAHSIYLANKKQGFWGAEDADPKTSRNFGEMLMLVTSELGEAMEAHRKDKFASWDAYNSIIKATPEDATEAESLLLKRQAFKTYIKDSAEDEIADAIIRLLDMAGGLGIDLFRHINAKLDYNSSRPRLHGKTY